jgi:large repetitive protein
MDRIDVIQARDRVMRILQHPLSPGIIRFSVLFMIVIASGSAFGQNYYGHNWYFGNTVNGIRFNRTDNSATLVTNKAIPFGTGGSGVATDKMNGNLLFYTDGSRIFDITHNAMPNGTGLAGNTSGNQPVAIAKVPGQNTQYYVFTNSANFTGGGTIVYSIVDMSQFGNAVFPNPALGDVTQKNQPIGAGLTARGEAMITVQHANGEDFWLITHSNGSPDYRVQLFTAAGLASTLDFPGIGLIEVAANFSYHAGSGMIAVSPQETTRDIEIINFDNANGVISLNQTVLNTGKVTATNQSIYDTEWSNSGRYLYISQHGDAGIQADVLQYDVQNPTTSLASILSQPISRSYGLQMAPDSAIYHLYQGTAGGPFVLGKITDSDTVASAVAYDPTAFTSNPNFDGMQFPAFAPADTTLMTVTFTSQGNCSNAPTSFFPTVTPGADSLVWDFGDGSGGAGWSPVYIYQAGGTYSVTVTAYLNGNTATATNTITITQFDLQVTMVQDTTACACELPINEGVSGCPASITPFTVTAQAQGGTPTYQWYGPGGLLTGQTTETLNADSAGYYYVIASVGACATYAGVNIKEYDSLDQRANIWHFGNHAGIDFNPLPDDPAVAIVGPLDTPEGCAVICDQNGQIILSTDGQNVFTRNTSGGYTDITPIPNPPGLGGDPGSTQSALIMPVGNDQTLFYIFTTQEVHGTGTYQLKYSLYDIKLNNGTGGFRDYNRVLFSKSTERITGSGNWLIAHEYGNNSFRAYFVSQFGISNPVISAIGSDHSLTVAENGQGYMELGAQNRLAVALSTPGVSNVVEIFDFVDSTGVVTNFRTANLNNPAGQVYGIEISPSGNKLFATLKGANSSIYEFMFDTLGNPYFQQFVVQAGELGAMQRGPDGQIYVAINGSSSLGTFTANEDTTQLTALTVPLQPFALAPGTSSELGLPNFIQIIANPTMTPSVDFVGTCLGDSTQFFATGKDPAIDKFDWFFGDGTSAIDSGAQINHLYAAAGTYNGTVRIYNKCEEVATFPFTVTITAPPADPSGGFVLCNGPVTLDANPGNVPNLTYLWSTGQTTETIIVDIQGTFGVTITDPVGCTTDANLGTFDNRPIVNFGPDQTLCQNTPVMALNAQNPGSTYSWAINGAPTGGTAQTQAVDTSTPGAFEYTVLVTDPVTTCFRRDTINYTINESPAFTSVTNGPIACNSNTGQITVTITAPATSLFTWFVTGPSGTFSNTDQAVGSFSAPATPTLAAGTYGITVSDQVSGCATTNTAAINNSAFTAAATQNGTCDPTIVMDVTTTPAVVTAVTYRVLDNLTGLVLAPGVVNEADGTFSTFAVPSGTDYVVEVTETATNCVATTPPVTITSGAQHTVTFDPSNLCTNSTLTAIAAGATTFDWAVSPAGSVTPTNAATVTVNPGTWNLTVTASGGALCPGTGTIPVTAETAVAADFTQTDPCQDVVTLDATPIGSYTYRWYRNGTLIPGGRQIAANLPDNGAQYRVELVSALSGCVYTSAEKVVPVSGDLQVVLSINALPCEGVPFTLTSTVNQTTGLAFAWQLDGAPIANQTTSTLQDTRAGRYTSVVTRTNPPGTPCVQTEDFNITLAPRTPGLLVDVEKICPGAPMSDPNRVANLDPGPDFLSYDWYKDGVSLNYTDQVYTAMELGEYSVEMINLYGCPSTDQTLIVEECDPLITGPNAFRPTSGVLEGGEYINREFRLFTFFIDDTDFQVFIFNRWGEMVYQTNDRNFRWNGGWGNNPSQPLPAGTYSYIVKFKSSYRPQDGIKEQRGGVVLLR